MSKSKFMLIALAALGIAATGSFRAGGGHAHKAPHGGIVIEVGQHRHFELVVQDKQFLLYVLDSHEAAMPLTGMTAGADILVKGKPRVTVPLTVSGDHFVGAQALDPAGRTTIIVTVKSAGKSLLGRFTYPVKKQHRHHGDSAPHAH